ncbi:MAG: hypothetical protein GEU96_10685 [Propionibacteriales bacterium]|nr:hypothetical protein [Propionibacteriales bacterium]
MARATGAVTWVGCSVSSVRLRVSRTFAAATAAAARAIGDVASVSSSISSRRPGVLVGCWAERDAGAPGRAGPVPGPGRGPAGGPDGRPACGGPGRVPGGCWRVGAGGRGPPPSGPAD